MSLYTEKEAAEKWCPYGAEDSVTTAGHIKRYVAPPNGRCIGSRCMAWRSASHPLQWEGEKVRITIPDTRPPVGYCGAFGKVEP